MEYSLFMIKPCAYDSKDEILSVLSKKINVIFTKDITLDEKLLNRLYKNEKNSVYKKINIEQLKNGKACIGLVSGKNAIEDLISICGNKPKGSMCAKETIRHKYMPKKETINIGKQIFFLNAIHKSDAEDALNDVCFFITEFLQEEIKKCKIDYTLDNENDEK